MRTVAAFSLECTVDNAVQRVRDVLEEIKRWLKEKGWEGEGQAEFLNKKGKKNGVFISEDQIEECELVRIALVEELEDSIFSTNITLGRVDNSCAIYIELRITGLGSRILPFQFDVRRPKFLGRLLHDNLEWQLGETPLTDVPYTFVGTESGDRISDMLWHKDRTVPAVVISLQNGKSITNEFAERLAGDLAGLAIVATIDEEAAWRLTKKRGSEWSCFEGAIRLYWPISVGSSDPRFHPLWFKNSILRKYSEPENASYKMRSQIRRRILGVSTFSVRESRIIREVTRRIREDKQKNLRNALKASETSGDFKEIAESYAKDNDQLREELKDKEEKLTSLEDQVAELQLALRYVPSRIDDVPTKDDEINDSVPTTVAEAVERSQQLFTNIIFSDDIDDGIYSLNIEAGPPEKIFKYLAVLNDMGAELIRTGSLGDGVVPWLRDSGLTCSIESKTIRNQGGRKYKFDGKEITFDYHLKPSDNVSPDKCVRIYFKPTNDGKVLIGWVGRHPE